MPSSGALAPPRLPIEDTYLELLADTLESLDLPARGQFLQRFLRAICHVELRESECVQIWDEMLNRRRALTDQAGRPVVLKAALMDVLATSGFLRVPIILEYEELKKLELNAVTDPLTGLYNRRLFGESFEKELNRACPIPRGDRQRLGLYRICPAPAPSRPRVCRSRTRISSCLRIHSRVSTCPRGDNFSSAFSAQSVTLNCANLSVCTSGTKCSIAVGPSPIKRAVPLF